MVQEAGVATRPEAEDYDTPQLCPLPEEPAVMGVGHSSTELSLSSASCSVAMCNQPLGPGLGGMVPDKQETPGKSTHHRDKLLVIS